ncbi:SDR family NAD(P)-dependent oxidoreductase [Rhabdaerophilum sp. SD176]|uniref:SDR family NAD(P)-dependent oxidoreductase n=1 Tax=Rhabdaerophilum sp. SD176 TaxID=2983548 RepID=UPI0024DFCDAA|nr:SDR family NAD(P)-dependent oxidoreductase [Rhabdaerophilum sp. SD176]
MPSLTGQHALVTGGSRGIGQAVAAALKGAGARVTITGRDRARLESALAEGWADAAFPLDLTDEAGTAPAIAALGPLDIVVANAGGAETQAFLKADAAHWRRMLDLNLIGTMLTFQAALPAMIERRRGRLITIASTAAHRGYAYTAAYAASKHAVLGMVRSLALEVARHGITVNAVSPGFTDTDLVAGAVDRLQDKGGLDRDAAKAKLAAENPLGRLIRPEEVAASVLFLAGEGATGLSGQSILVNGGEF